MEHDDYDRSCSDTLGVGSKGFAGSGRDSGTCRFCKSPQFLGPIFEDRWNGVFEKLPEADFSRNFLPQIATRGLVRPLEEVFWSDWGRPEARQVSEPNETGYPGKPAAPTVRVFRPSGIAGRPKQLTGGN